MTNTLVMQDLRYLNLFSKITRVNTRYFFRYNNMLVFFVPKRLVSKALGKDAENLRKMSKILGKRIRVVAQPLDLKEVKTFIASIIHPITFNDVEVVGDEVVVNAGKMNKAALIGRDKKRLSEMKKIIQTFFKKDFRVA